jgi:hypothetical protein
LDNFFSNFYNEFKNWVLKNKKSIMIKIAIALGILVSATLLMKKKDMSYRQSILKTLYPMIMWSSHSSGAKQVLSNQQSVVAPVSFYTLHAKAIDGSDINFAAYKGKKIMIVNTASDCGFTGQYEALEKLHQQYSAEIEHQQAIVGKLIEPIFIIILGLFVGFILVAMYLPMFEMSTNSF